MPLRSLQMRFPIHHPPCGRNPDCVKSKGHIGRCRTSLVGMDLHIYWNGDQCTYPGKVMGVDEQAKTVDILYADSQRDRNVPLALLRNLPIPRPTKKRLQPPKKRPQPTDERPQSKKRLKRTQERPQPTDELPQPKKRLKRTQERPKLTQERQQLQAADALLQLEESPVVAQHSELDAAYATIRAQTKTIIAQAETIAALEHQVEITQGLCTSSTRGRRVR